MAKKKEFESLMDAAEKILAGKPVNDLPARIRGIYHLSDDDFQDIRAGEFLPFLICLDTENRILQGENPADAYKTSDYKESQDLYQKLLKCILDKYRQQ